MKTDLNIGNDRDRKVIFNNEDYEKLLNFIKTFLQKNISKYTEVDSIILFGSYATKNYTEESDIDLCILFKNDIDNSSNELIFEHFLDLEKELDKSIQCVFIHPEEINNWDRIFIENILAEGQLLYGNSQYYEKLIKFLDLEPYLIITFKLKGLDSSTKMKLKRILYGYKTNKQYSNKIYSYQKKGLVQKLKGIKLGRGSFAIPEKYLSLIRKEFDQFNVKFSKIRTWMQKI